MSERKAIIYIHGFNSAPNSSTFQELKEMFKDEKNADVFAPSYNFINAHDSIKDLSSYVNLILDKYIDVVLVGTSLGGYWASLLGESLFIPTVIINPTINPYVSLTKYIGKNKNFATNVEYDFTFIHVSTFEFYLNAASYGRVILGTKDEIINYRESLAHFENKAEITLIKEMGHRLDFSIPNVKETLKKKIEEALYIIAE